LRAQSSENAGKSLRNGAQKACELSFGDGEFENVRSPVLIDQIEKVRGQPAGNFLQRQIIDQGSESPEAFRKNRQHIESQRGVPLDEIHEGFPWKKENPAFLQGLGIGWKMLTRKNGHFAKRFPWSEKVEDLFFSIRRQLEYLDPAGDDHIEPVCIIAFRKDGYPFFEQLIRYDHGQIIDLLRRQTFKERNASDVINDWQRQIPS
jgi:hypothetical protein